ncbi:iron-containing alcohol dehydrogenase [Variovorax sp. J22P271]|uniref:iron-containing alcohol dehydrogenase family protein n=1 Tax=Variovorax davisae TaxID=3053515 RepID=UPI0025775555|nr:iron-containing alcohol dehydrogenase [Variovorax sp. J22P271]MDM0033574.1 iron-containing alcohol dehydrogenase [Variovorax sp. J22P271]
MSNAAPPSFFGTQPDRFDFAWPGHAVFGAGCAQQLPAWAAARGVARPLVLSDGGLVRAGIVAPMLDALRAAGLTPALFDGVAANPTLANATQARAHWDAHGCDGLVAIGGGSVIDVGKVLIAGLCADAPIEQVLREGERVLTRDAPPFAALPTTAGTGSESTTAALVKDGQGRKHVLRSRRSRPQWVALDPQLTLSVPASVTASTGFDTVMHALGAATNRASNPVGEALALQALALSVQALPAVLADPSSLKARSDMLLASYLAGVAMSLRGVDGIHGLCTPLEALVDVPHAHVLAVTCVPLMRFTLSAAASRYAQAARSCGLGAAGRDDEALAHALVDEVDRLRQLAGLPRTLAELGLHAAQLAPAIEAALDNASLRLNARQPTRDEIAALYQSMRPA